MEAGPTGGRRGDVTAVLRGEERTSAAVQDERRLLNPEHLWPLIKGDSMSVCLRVQSFNSHIVSIFTDSQEAQLCLR